MARSSGGQSFSYKDCHEKNYVSELNYRLVDLEGTSREIGKKREN